MIRRLLTAVASVAVLAVVVPSIASAEPTYTDPQTYQVDPKYPYLIYPSSYDLNNHYPWESSYTFNPASSYSAAQQQAILQDEVGRTGGALSTDSTGSLITVGQGSIPEASTPNVPAPVEQLPLPDGISAQGGNYNKSYSRTESFGNSLFGAGYAINASITATDASGARAKQVDALAEGKVFATAFSTQKDIVLGRVQIHGEQGGSNTGTAALYTLGQQIWSANLSYSFSPTPIDWSRTFFSVSKTFMVGPVPITVKASLAGGVKLAVTGLVSPTVARVMATPAGWSNVTASASVNIIVASFGIEGSLTLINASMPSYGELFWPLCDISWTLRSNLVLNTLSGNLDLYAKINFIFFSKKWTLNIARWSGLNYNWSLLNIDGSKELGICN